MRTNSTLTKRQREILAFISRFRVGKGYPPTIREIREAFGLRSNRGVIDHLRALERKGYIRRGQRSSRAIELLRGEDGERAYEEDRVLAYPIAGRIEAGVPAAPIEQAGDSWLLDRDLFGERGDFILEVEGDSMIGDNIVPGDMLVVQRTESCAEGDIVVAMVDGETTVKRLVRMGRRVALVASNDRYPPIVFAGRDPRTCTIIGRVVGMLRRLGRRTKPFSD